ncbi:MAG TPA: phosphoserine transaminase [Gammaproteobacteria bacterium]|nr:phosphoserine transaminase [Gammaproteobacteria bacterium]
MNEEAVGLPVRPLVKPVDARFSSGPCKKYPGWDLSHLNTAFLGRSHRARLPRQRLKDAIDHSHRLLGLPADWKLGIVPGSDTGAFEIALWSLLGSRPVDALVWESFSADWARDLQALGIENLNLIEADYGELPDLARVEADHDLVTVYNGTTSGVCLSSLDWLDADREGLVLCDATSAAFAMPMDFARLDVVTWSWQKVLGGEGAHGMLALSPRAVERLETVKPRFPLPKLFRLTKNGKLAGDIFTGATINTPSLLAVEDLHAALDWADGIGGREALWRRTRANFECLDAWVGATPWVDWLARVPATRSPTSMCLRLVDPAFTAMSNDAQQQAVDAMVARLEQEGAALDIGNYRAAPPGFRIWGGATVDTSDLEALTPWLDWAFADYQHSLQEKRNG